MMVLGLFTILFLCGLDVSFAGYDWVFGNSSVWLSAAAYCETNTYQTRTFKGPSAGFVVTNVIDNKSEDVQVNNIYFLLYFPLFLNHSYRVILVIYLPNPPSM